MRRFLLLIALAGCGEAAAQIEYEPGTVNFKALPRWQRGTVDPVLGKGLGSTCGGTFGTAKGAALSVSRASTDSAVCTDGTWVSATANNLVVTDKGAQLWGSVQNKILQSQNIADNDGNLVAPWAKNRSTVDGNNTAAPDGTLTSDDLIEDATLNDDHQVRQPWTATATTWTTSTFGKKAGARNWMAASADGGVTLAYFNVSTGAKGVTGTGNTTAIQAAASSWYRVSVTRAQTGATAIVLYGADGDNDVTTNGNSSLVLNLWGSQAELGAVAGPYVVTAGAPVTQPATVLSKTCDIGTGVAAMTITVAINAQWGSNIVGLWALGASGANSIQAYVTTTKVLTVVVTDGTSTAKTWTSAALTMTAGTNYEIAISYTPATHTISAAQAGVEKTMTGVGTGVAPDSYNATITYGFDGTNYALGYLSKYVECTGAILGSCT